MFKSKFDDLWNNVEDEISNIRLKRDKFFIDCCSSTLLNNDNQNFDQFLRSEINRLTIDLQNRFDPISKDVSKTETAYYYYLLGKINNLSSEYSLICEDYLTKAIKLDPNSYASLFWNEMCECLWKKRDINGAKNCLDTVLRKGRDKITLRNLSIVLRQLEQCQNTDSLEFVTKSIQVAKEAVDLDAKDGTNILANANFVYFFKSDQSNEKFLNKSLELYEKALDDENIKFSSDLHYNKATAHTYMEQYEQALLALKRCLQLEPNFKKATEDLNFLENYLKRIYDNVVRKGKLKNSKIKQLSGSLKTASTTVVNDQSEYKIVHSIENELRFGPNPGTNCRGKVVSIIFNEKIIPYTFCIIDRFEFCSLVTVYNFDREKFGLVIGQTVEILDSDFDLIKYTVENQVYKYPRIRLQNPTKLIVNGKQCKMHDHVPSMTRVEMI